jgi:hypothetical protein
LNPLEKILTIVSIDNGVWFYSKSFSSLLIRFMKDKSKSGKSDLGYYGCSYYGFVSGWVGY